MIRATYLTRKGYEKLRKELEYMKKVKRREISKAIGEARAHGDISENAEYDAAKEAQGLLEKKIHEIEKMLFQVRIIEDENIPNDKVYIGSIVYLLDLDKDVEICYTLLSEAEADYSKGIISTTAPIGRGLLGREEGDEVTIRVPSGLLRFEILKICRIGEED